MGGSAGARWKTGDRLQGGWVIVVRDNPKIEVPKICWRRLQLSAALPARAAFVAAPYQRSVAGNLVDEIWRGAAFLLRQIPGVPRRGSLGNNSDQNLRPSTSPPRCPGSMDLPILRSTNSTVSLSYESPATAATDLICSPGYPWS